MLEMNYKHCLIVYCSSSISSSIRIYPLSRPFVFSAQELSRIRLPGFVIVFCICRTMRIRMHTDESTENGNRGLQSRLPLCIYSQSKFHWRSLANNQLKIQEEKKAIRHDWRWTWLHFASVQKDKTGTHTFLVVISPSLIIPLQKAMQTHSPFPYQNNWSFSNVLSLQTEPVHFDFDFNFPTTIMQRWDLSF